MQDNRSSPDFTVHPRQITAYAYYPTGCWMNSFQPLTTSIPEWKMQAATPPKPALFCPSGIARHFLLPGFAISCEAIQRVGKFFRAQQHRLANR